MRRSVTRSLRAIAFAAAAASLLTPEPGLGAPAGGGELTLIHMGDVHGHLVAHPSSPRAGAEGRTEGGLARMFSKIQEIRKRNGRGKTLLFNTGDTIQGSAETLFTRGEAIVDVLNAFGIDAYAPGNWDWVYGADRALELFAGPQPKAAWNALAANAYFDAEPYADRKGNRLLPPFLVREVNGLKIGILGFTSDRGPQVVGRSVTKGVRFTKGDEEVADLVRVLRQEQRVDLVVMLSELGIANNIRLSEKTPGIDVILSSDSHEVTREPVVTKTGTLVAEVGQDGQVLGELNLTLRNGRISGTRWTLHRIGDRVAEDAGVAARVRAARTPFVSGPGFVTHVNPFNQAKLSRPLDTVVGWTKVALHRTGFDGESAPAVIEGTSHALLTDAFRAATQADIGAIRGFRYGTVVPPGPIRLEDLYHFIPIGPMIAKGIVKGKQIKNQIENSADGSLNPDPAKWTGGWLFNFSGLRTWLDPYAGAGERAKRIEVLDAASGSWMPLDPERSYTYASYYYARDPELINAAPAKAISVLAGRNGEPLDAVDVVAGYLASQPEQTVAPETGRTTLLTGLPQPISKSPEIQPWRGATHPPLAAISASAAPPIVRAAAKASAPKPKPVPRRVERTRSAPPPAARRLQREVLRPSRNRLVRRHYPQTAAARANKRPIHNAGISARASSTFLGWAGAGAAFREPAAGSP